MSRQVHLIVALLLGTIVAGCVAPQPIAPDAASPVIAAEAWLGNWMVERANLTIDYDPEGRHNVVAGTLAIRNLLGEARPYVHIHMEPLTVTRLQDEAGDDLAFTVEPVVGDPLRAVLPDDVATRAIPYALVNVTLTGDVGHGARRILSIAYEGWADQASALYQGTGNPALNVDVPVGAPVEAAQNLHWTLVPYLAPTRSGVYDVVVRSPSTWTTLASAPLVDWQDDGTTVTATYTVRDATVPIYSAKGLEFREEDVGGVNVRTYFYPDMRLQGRSVHETVKRVLATMPDVTGPYPLDHLWTVPVFEAWDAIFDSGTIFVGMYYYRTHVDGLPLQDGAFGFRNVPFVAGQASHEWVVVHEAVHAWWGHNLRGNVSTPEVDTRWLTEGITMYLSEIVWFHRQYGDSDGAATSRDKSLGQLQIRLLNGGDEGAARPGGNPYITTAVGLRALESYAVATGRPNATFDALKFLQARHGIDAGGKGVVLETDVFAVFEEVFGEDLTAFWEAYIVDGEVPDLRVLDVAVDGREVTVSLGDADLAGAQVVAVTATGRELWGWATVRDGTGAVVLDRGATLESVVRVEVDPHHWVYEADEGNNAWVGYP